MQRKRKTALAWKNLTHDWRRLAVALAGIAFASLLMFSQVGFQTALFDSQVKMLSDLNADIFLVSKAKFTLAAEKRFPIEWIMQARSCLGVEGAYPVYTELTTSVLRKIEGGVGNRGYPIRSIGFPVDAPVFEWKGFQTLTSRLKEPGTALIDSKSKENNFPFEMKDDNQLSAASVELAGQRVKLVGTFQLGTDFAHDGNLVMSDENFARYFPVRNRFGDPLNVVDIGVIHVAEGFSVDEIQQRLSDVLSKDVLVLKKQEYRDKEIKFWDTSTPIAAIFRAGIILGFVVGMVICYQVIYSDITDHLPEFATLKAMGYSTSYFIRLIVVESILLALIGFIPGFVASYGLYLWLAEQTGLFLHMTLENTGIVLAATVAMCICSGMLAVRKLLAADPASLF